MPRVVENLQQQVGLSDAEIRKLIIDNPARILAGAAGSPQAKQS
jgi:predicted metal-dependent phosphotriesterase family hydrolase